MIMKIIYIQVKYASEWNLIYLMHRFNEMI
jgi:hypothetical protein